MTEMEHSKLMIPLFYGHSFNRESCKMRAVFEREISDGAQTYRLWRGTGTPDVDYPRAENDKYLLHVEINGYLLPLGMTDFYLVNDCGFEPAAEKLYGGGKNRGKWIDALRESGGNDAVSAALTEEAAEIERFGRDPVCQAKFIRSLLDKKVNTYLKSKENGGQTHPDFCGALIVDDLARCRELSAIYRAKCEAEEAACQARAAEEEKAYCEEQNRVAEQAVSAAIQVIRTGGVLKNETVKFYHSQYSVNAYSIVNYLMRLYQVNVPLRTQGWINEKLVSATIQDGKCEYLQYYRGKSGRSSQKFFECMNDLIRAVQTAQNQVQEGAA